MNSPNASNNKAINTDEAIKAARYVLSIAKAESVKSGSSLFRVGRELGRKVEFGSDEVHHVDEVLHIAVPSRPTLG